MTVTSRLRQWARQVKRDGITLWFAVKDPRTPWYAKTLAAFVVAYALSPIDLIPDFVPVLGYVDDVLLLPGLIWLTIKLLPKEVLIDSRSRAEALMAADRGRPTSKVGAAFVLLLWILASWLVWHEYLAGKLWNTSTSN